MNNININIRVQIVLRIMYNVIGTFAMGSYRIGIIINGSRWLAGRHHRKVLFCEILNKKAISAKRLKAKTYQHQISPLTV